MAQAQQFEEIDLKHPDFPKEIITVKVPKGTSDDIILKEVGRQMAAITAKQPREGPLGVVNPEVREDFRQSVEKQPFVKRMAIESAGPAIGTAIGGGIGALAAPITGGLSIPIGMGLGGLGGELLSQETGFSPRSKVAAGAAAVAPAAGVLASKGGQLAARVAAKGVGKLTPVEAATSKIALEKATREVDSVATRILSSQKGLMALPAKSLYGAVRKAGVKISPDTLPQTKAAIQSLKNEMADFRAFPEAQQALGLLDDVEQTLGLRKLAPTVDENLAAAGVLPKAGVRTDVAPDINFEALVKARQLVGAAIEHAESARGVRLGSAKKVFSGIADDMDNLAKLPGLKGSVARTALRATKRAKLQFAVDDFKAIIAKATTSVRGDEDAVAINAKQVLDRLSQLTNKNSDKFDNNFTTALGDQLPEIKAVFEAINKIPVSPAGGAGSLVIRGSFAREMRSLATKTLGFATAGTLAGGPVAGLVAGSAAVFGARMPEMITAGLLRPKGRKFLLSVAKFGRGQLNQQKIGVLSQIGLGTVTRAEESGRTKLQEKIKGFTSKSIKTINP